MNTGGFSLCNSFSLRGMIVFVFSAFLLACDDGMGGGLGNAESVFDVHGIDIVGKATYWRTKDARNFEVVVLDLRSGDKEVVRFPSVPSDVEVIGKGRILTSIRKDVGAVSRLCIFNMIDGECGESEIIETGSVFSPEFHDQKVAYYVKEGDGYFVKVADLRTGGVFYIDCPERDCAHPSWNDEGDEIAFVVNERQVVVYDLVRARRDGSYEFKDDGVVTGVDFSWGAKGQTVFASFMEGGFSHSMKSRVVSLDFVASKESVVLELDKRVLGIYGTSIANGLIALVGDRENNQNLYFYNVASGGGVMISDPGWIAGPASWSE